jgi:hypothetical protein
MRRTRIRFGTAFTVFVLFFGVATLEAFQTQNWLKAGIWLAIGIVFLIGDNLGKAQSYSVELDRK